MRKKYYLLQLFLHLSLGKIPGKRRKIRASALKVDPRAHLAKSVVGTTDVWARIL